MDFEKQIGHGPFTGHFQGMAAGSCDAVTIAILKRGSWRHMCDVVARPNPCHRQFCSGSSAFEPNLVCFRDWNCDLSQVWVRGSMFGTDLALHMPFGLDDLRGKLQGLRGFVADDGG